MYFRYIGSIGGAEGVSSALLAINTRSYYEHFLDAGFTLFAILIEKKANT
jgi:hypothetical protein